MAVSIVPEQTFVKKVAGNKVNVVTLIPPGSSPESYAPTPKTMADLSHAKIYFDINVPTEKANILPKIHSQNPSIKIVNLWDAAAKKYPARHFQPGVPDTHAWMSPKRSIVMVQKIEKELSSVDPKNQAVYEKNAEAYIKHLNSLNTYILNTLKPLKQRTFIAYHPAFGYFAKDYNLKMISLEQDGKDASPKQVQKVIDDAKKKGIKVILYQAQIDSKQSQSIAEELGGKTVQLDPLAPDYIKNMKKMAHTFKSVME